MHLLVYWSQHCCLKHNLPSDDYIVLQLSLNPHHHFMLDKFSVSIFLVEFIKIIGKKTLHVEDSKHPHCNIFSALKGGLQLLDMFNNLA